MTSNISRDIFCNGNDHKYIMSKAQCSGMSSATPKWPTCPPVFSPWPEPCAPASPSSSTRWWALHLSCYDHQLENLLEKCKILIVLHVENSSITQGELSCQLGHFNNLHNIPKPQHCMCYKLLNFMWLWSGLINKLYRSKPSRQPPEPGSHGKGEWQGTPVVFISALRWSLKYGFKGCLFYFCHVQPLIVERNGEQLAVFLMDTQVEK